MSNSAAAGIVRQARRPEGWCAPGPAPPLSHDRELGPFANEDLCYLSGDWRILQRIDGHRWSLDDLVTAWVASALPRHAAPRRILDLGCGIGSVLLMLAWRFPTSTLVGVEAQSVSVDLAQRSVAWNGIEDRCSLHRGDLRDVAVVSDHAPFDLITGTPPYFPVGTGVPSEYAQCGPCLFEERGGIEDYCSAAARLLAPHAAFVVCAASLQRERVETGARRAALQIVSELKVIPRAGKAPLFSVYIMRRPPVTHMSRSSLTVRDKTGHWTPAFATVRHEMGLPPPLPRPTAPADSA